MSLRSEGSILAAPGGEPVMVSNEPELNEVLTRPGVRLIQSVTRLESPLLVLGGGGKMGPTLAVLARRAALAAGHSLEVIAVSRFTSTQSRDWLEAHGVRTIACDLLNANEISRLPDAKNVVYLVGLKFGTRQNPSATWATNTLVPARICERYPNSRIVALSTGNVYSLSQVSGTGSRESEPLLPIGEYPNAALARERIFEFASQQYGTPVTLIRLFYAVELRYGVLVDIAQAVSSGVPITLSNGRVSCIWQGDANDMILRAFPLTQSPPSVWNLCLPATYSVRDIAHRFAEIFGRNPQFDGHESDTALLGDSSRLCLQLGAPPTTIDTMIRWIAGWVQNGGRSLGRPTHFEVRDGRY